MPVRRLSDRVSELIRSGRETLLGGSLKGKIFRNVGWLAIAFVCDVLVRLVSSMILTRLLDPGAYGLISTVMVFLVFVTLLSDLGIKTLVITDDRGDDPAFLRTLWTMQIIRGFLIALVVSGIALGWMHAQNVGWIGPDNSYANPLLPKLVLLCSFMLVLMGFSSVNEYRLIRHLEIAAITRIDIGSRVFTAAVTIVLAFIFRSVWAIALGMLLSNLMRMALTHIVLSGPRMKWQFNWAEVRGVLTHSRWVALNSMMTVLTTQADKALMGYGFGMAALGIYTIALSLYQAAASVVDQLNNALGMPVLRALLDKTPEERARDYYRFRLPIELYCMAGGTGMALLGQLFFKIAYDPRYELGGLFFALLGVKIVLLPMHLSGNFLFAQQRYRLMSAIGTVRAFVFLSGMVLAMAVGSQKLMVVVIALEHLPEIIAFFLLPRTGVPFRLSRDGVLLSLAAALLTFLLIGAR